MYHRITPAKILAQLSETRASHVSGIVSHVNDMTVCSDEKSGSKISLSDSLYKDGGLNVIRFMCNFIPPEIDEIWFILSSYFSANWNVCGGCKTNLSGK